MAYKEWGDPANPKVLVCVHGITRVSDDFDYLARVLSERDHYRVICPDIVGRGRSGWLRDPQQYQIPQYVSDMVTLLAKVNAGSLDWLGTSMGGLIGMGLASLPDNPIRKLILNDIGPVLQPDAIARIGKYIGQDVRFATFEEAAAFIRSISQSFGPHTEQEWHKMAVDVLRQDECGQWKRHYDPSLTIPFCSLTVDQLKELEHVAWAAYDAVHCPTLIVRGADSDLLTRETAEEMTRRGPRAKYVELLGIGHAPTFMHADQIALVRDFLIQ